MMREADARANVSRVWRDFDAAWHDYSSLGSRFSACASDFRALRQRLAILEVQGDRLLRVAGEYARCVADGSFVHLRYNYVAALAYLMLRALAPRHPFAARHDDTLEHHARIAQVTHERLRSAAAAMRQREALAAAPATQACAGARPGGDDDCAQERMHSPVPHRLADIRGIEAQLENVSALYGAISEVLDSGEGHVERLRGNVEDGMERVARGHDALVELYGARYYRPRAGCGRLRAYACGAALLLCAAWLYW
jgi:hypothetical protein